MLRDRDDDPRERSGGHDPGLLLLHGGGSLVEGFQHFRDARGSVQAASEHVDGHGREGLEGEELDDEFQTWRTVEVTGRVAEHVSGADVRSVERELESHVVSGDGPLGRFVVYQDGLYECGFAGWDSEDGVAGLDVAGFNAADDGRLRSLGHVRDADTERLRDEVGQLRLWYGLQEVEERWAAVPFPGGGDPVLAGQVLTRQAAEGDKRDFISRKSSQCQEMARLLDNLLVPVVGPADCVELVDGNDESGHADRPDKQCMFLSLPSGLNTGFESTGRSIENEYGKIGLCRAGNHVGDKVAMARGVQDREACLWGLKLVGRNVHCYAAGALFGRLVEHPRIVEG